MSVDIYLMAHRENQEYDYVVAGITSPSVWFGYGSYVYDQKGLFALKGLAIDDMLINTLMNWPRDPGIGVFNDQERAAVFRFLESNRGSYLRLYAG